MKKCSKCKKEKCADNFCKRASSKDGLDSWCKECKSTADKDYCKRNKDKIVECKKQYYSKNKNNLNNYKKGWYEKNKEKILEMRKNYYKNNKEIISHKNAEWRKNNKERKNAYDRKYIRDNKERLRERRRNNPQIRIADNLRRRINSAIRSNQKVGSAVRDLGCSIEYLKQHLENQFKLRMTWNNYGKWHIDHIIPLKSFDLTNREQFLHACHYTNLQPLWAEENLSKGAKIL